LKVNIEKTRPRDEDPSPVKRRDHSPKNKFKLHEPEKPLVKAYVKSVVSKTEATLIVEIPSQLDQVVEFSFDVQKDTPEGTAEDLIGFLKVPSSFIKPVAHQIRIATEKLEREYAQEALQ